MSEVKASLHDMRTEMKQSLKETEDRITAVVDRDLAERRERDAQRHAEIQEIKNEFKEFKVAQEETRQEILALRGEAGVLHTDNSEAKTAIGDLKTDSQTLKTDVATLKTDVKDLHKDTRIIIRWVMGLTGTMVIGFISILATLLRH